MVKPFTVEQVFRLENPKGKLTTKQLIDGNDIPYVAAKKTENGIAKWCSLENIPNEQIMQGNCIVFVQQGDGSAGYTTYQPEDFYAISCVCCGYIDGILDEKVGMYLMSILDKNKAFYNHSNGWNGDKLRQTTMTLPVIENPNPDHEYTVDDIDWQYMRDRITELERDRITELDAYLQATGLNDYELTEDDKKILSLSAKRTSDEDGTLEDNSKDAVRYGEFTLGGDDGLFDIYAPQKRFNANTITFGGKYPYVARGSSNNGIRGYITEDTKYLSPAKSLSFGQDTATVYYQPDAYFTGDKIKVMVLKDRELTPELAEYFISVISRAFSTFAWGQSSFNENIIKGMKIVLPVKSDDTPDFDYMERYIRAMEKVVIADVVKYKDRVIETTKKVVEVTR